MPAPRPHAHITPPASSYACPQTPAHKPPPPLGLPAGRFKHPIPHVTSSRTLVVTVVVAVAAQVFSEAATLASGLSGSRVRVRDASFPVAQPAKAASSSSSSNSSKGKRKRKLFELLGLLERTQHDTTGHDMPRCLPVCHTQKRASECCLCVSMVVCVCVCWLVVCAAA